MTTIVEIITIGREILDGRVIDTNAVAIAEALRTLGLTTRFAQKVDDELDRVVDAFKIAQGRSRLVLVTGGLGPTSDDLTAEAFGRFLGEPVAMNPEALRQVEEVFARFNRPITDVQRKQAMLPPSCFLLPNAEGTAPGFGLTRDGVSWYFMPGVPREMTRMLRDQILPRVRAEGLAAANPRTMTWATQFTSEGRLQEALTPVERKLPPGFEITYRTRFPENHIGLYATCPGPRELEAFDAFAREIGSILGADAFSSARDLDPLPGLEDVVIALLRKHGTWLATVESCTGGLVANRVTGVSGSSEVFWGSFVTYDNSAKTSLGVPEQLLVQHGAVSPEVARALAESGLRRMIEAKKITGPAACISTTGIAGPGGGSEKKPVGLCHVGLAWTSGSSPFEVTSQEVRARFGLDRTSNKLLFAQKALEALRQQLLGLAG